MNPLYLQRFKRFAVHTIPSTNELKLKLLVIRIGAREI